jgi:aromatic-L-amino-acid decarboxylase
MDAQEFRCLGHQLIDWVADYRESIERFPVMSQVQPGAVRAAFAAQPPQQGQGMDQALHMLERDILPGITHWNHPAFFAYFPSITSYPSILADLVTAGLGAQGLNWQASPAAAEVEEVVMDWLRQMLGLSPSFSGVIHDTASTATLCALLCAREKVSNYAQNGPGLQGGGAPLIVYASDQGHSSIEKAALLAGFGKHHLRLIATDGQHAMRLDLLEAAIANDLAAGRLPCALVGCVGTTGTTAIDPLPALAALAQQHGMWFHVDAAMAGTAMLLPECRSLWQGVESADSLILNPHKWMGVGFDFAAYFVRDPQHLIRVMSTNPSYLQTTQDGAVKNYRDWHIQLGRRFRALKLWFVLADQGVEGLQARLRRDLENAQWLRQQVVATADWECMAPVPFQTVCIRHVPARLKHDPAALNAHNLALAQQINESGQAYLTPSMLKGQQILRVSIGSEPTERQHVAALWQQLCAIAN